MLNMLNIVCVCVRARARVYLSKTFLLFFKYKTTCKWKSFRPRKYQPSKIIKPNTLSTISH